jgi:predicted AAA+ superfamily ATPase
MIPRQASPQLQALAQWYPVLAMTGPRQSGKTTLVQATFPDKPYVSLEDPDVAASALSDPRRFLGQFPEGAILDEAQRAPELFSYLQSIVDRDRAMGAWVLTGSQQLGLRSQISQSLAGRVGLLELLPFTLGELQAAKRPFASMEDLLWRGLYPVPLDRGIPPGIWLADYFSTYIERDVRQMLNVRDLQTFRTFVRMCAARTSQVLNLSALAADCGISSPTAKGWLSILEASYIVFLLPPHHRNFGKQLTKSPKLYFYDTGLAAWLAGVRSAEELALSSLRGPLFETWAVSETLKVNHHLRLDARLFYWRDKIGSEVDLLIERAERLQTVEFKAGQTVAGDWFAALRKYETLRSGAASQPELQAVPQPRPVLVYGGSERQTRDVADICPWQKWPETLTRMLQ